MNSMLEQFIKSLITLTDRNLIQWQKIRNYLDREYNRILENYLVKYVQYNYEYLNGAEIDINSSYVSQIDGSLVYLFNYREFSKNYYEICVQNDIDSDIREVKLLDNSLLNKLVTKVGESVNSEERTIEKVINIAKSRIGSIDDEV